MDMKDKKKFSGWNVLIGCFFIMFMQGMIFNITSIYIKPISESLLASRSQTSMYITMMNFAMMAGTLLVGKIAKKIGIKKVMLLGTTMLGAGTFIFTISNSIAVFYLGALIVGFGAGISTTVPVLILINNWFVKNRGTIISIIMLATTLGGVIFSPIGNYLIETSSWRTSYLVNSIIIFVVAIPSIIFFVIEHPSQKGQIAYGEEITDTNKEKVIHKEGLTLKEALSKSYFWILAISLLLIGMQMGIISSQVVPFLTDNGLTTTFASSIVSIFLLSASIGKPIGGMLFDKVGVKKGCMIGLTFTFLGNLLLNISTEPSIIVLFSIFAGFGVFIVTLAPSLLTSECFGRKDYDSIIGVTSVFPVLGTAIGPLISSFMYDTLGNYSLVFKICLIVTPILMILISMAISQANKTLKQKHQDRETLQGKEAL